MHPVVLAPVLTPHGHLSLAPEDDALALNAEVAQRLQATFARGAGHGLLQLGAGEVGTALPAAFSYWREFAARYVTALCMHPSLSADAPDTKTVEAVAPPRDAELEWLAMAAPLMTGAEYLTVEVLRALWRETDKALRVELCSESSMGIRQASGDSVPLFQIPLIRLRPWGQAKKIYPFSPATARGVQAKFLPDDA